jgi:hypothetical protein
MTWNVEEAGDLNEKSLKMPSVERWWSASAELEVASAWNSSIEESSVLIAEIFQKDCCAGVEFLSFRRHCPSAEVVLSMLLRSPVFDSISNSIMKVEVCFKIRVWIWQVKFSGRQKFSLSLFVRSYLYLYPELIPISIYIIQFILLHLLFHPFQAVSSTL